MTSSPPSVVRPRRRAWRAGPPLNPDPALAFRAGSLGYQRVAGDRGIAWDNATRPSYGEPYWLFQYTIAGGGWFRCHDRDHRLRPGQAFVTRIPAATAYGLEFGRRWEWLWCTMAGPMADDLGARILASGGHLLTVGAEAPAHRLVQWYESVGGGEAGPWRSLALGFEFWCGLLEWLDRRRARDDDPLQRAQRFIDDRFAEHDCGVAAAAAAAGVSRHHLARLAREQGEESLGERLRRRRLEAAHRWLVTSDLPVAEVAQRCGFGSAAHFGAAFRRHYGISPGRLRG